MILLTWIQAFPQLSGTLTIGGTSPDYASFNAAVTDLVANGVGGPVVFEIRPGTYPEQVTLPSISGASSTNTITFESSNGHSEDVILTYSPVDGPGNFTLKLDGASYCRFRNMTIQTTGSTYARVIILKGYYNKFIGNRLIGIRVSSDSDLFCLVDSYFNTDSYNEFTGNEFLYGSYGLYLSNATVHEQGTVIEDNLFTDQYASAI